MAYELTGQKFGRLTVLGPAAEKPRQSASRYWDCECECGNRTTVWSTGLVKGTTKSCGCYHRQRAKEAATTHGMSNTRTYTIWLQMRVRCKDDRSSSRAYYFDKSVTVDPAWERFETFLEDMGPAGPGMSLERKDNDLGYTRENCYWLPSGRQVDNRGVTKWVEFGGRRQTLAQWSKETGVPYHTLYQRLHRYHWPVERALTKPVKEKWTTDKLRDGTSKELARRKVAHAVRTGGLVRPDHCSYPGCPRRDIQAHHHKGYGPEHALDVVWVCPEHHAQERERRVEWDWQTLTLREWSRKTGVPLKTLRSRLQNRNWAPDEAVFDANPDRRRKMLTYRGETLSMKQWSERLGIRYLTLFQRLKKGLPLEQALSQKSLRTKSDRNVPGVLHR